MFERLLHSMAGKWLLIGLIASFGLVVVCIQFDDVVLQLSKSVLYAVLSMAAFFAYRSTRKWYLASLGLGAIHWFIAGLIVFTSNMLLGISFTERAARLSEGIRPYPFLMVITGVLGAIGYICLMAGGIGSMFHCPGPAGRIGSEKGDKSRSEKGDKSNY